VAKSAKSLIQPPKKKKPRKTRIYTTKLKNLWTEKRPITLLTIGTKALPVTIVLLRLPALPAVAEIEPEMVTLREIKLNQTAKFHQTKGPAILTLLPVSRKWRSASVSKTEKFLIMEL